MQMASWYYFDNGRWQQGFCALTFHKLGIVLKLTSAHTLIGRREYLPSFACKIVRSAKKRVLIRKKREKSGHAEEQGGGGEVGNLGNTPKNRIYLIPTSDLHSTSPSPSPTQPTWSFKSKWVGVTDFTQYEYSLS